MGKKVIDFMCTAFRDGFQSCYGARVLNKDFLPAMEACKDAGIKWFEHGGGAIFQSKVFYCNENPFTAMDEIRTLMGPDINLQTLARGVNVVGLTSQCSDFIKLHARLFKKHGVTTIRNFDALNDVENLIYSGKCIVEAGLKHQITITLMGLPPGLTGAHTPDFYEGILRKILQAGIPFDSICFKDASGTTPPRIVHETIKRARAILGSDAYIDFHSHCTADGCITGYMAAIEAGTNAIDLSIQPMSGGTSQPDILTMWHNFRDSEYCLDVDIDKVREAERITQECMSKYLLPPESQAVLPIIPWSPVPGGALTANTQMMRDNNELHLFPKLVEAMSECVRRGGFGTSVTPVSQFYIQQAYSNVKNGPWKKITDGYGRMVLGYFGRTPHTPDPELQKLASEQLGLPINTRPVLEINDADESKKVSTIKKKLEENNLPVTEENLFIVSACAEKGIFFLKGKGHVNVRYKEEKKAAAPAAAPAPAPVKKVPEHLTISVQGSSYDVTVKDGRVLVNGKDYGYTVAENGSAAAPAAAPAPAAAAPAAAPAHSPSPAASGTAHAITSPLPGTVIRIKAGPGTSVKKEDTILFIEAMKMEMEIKSDCVGTIKSIEVEPGDLITADSIVAYVE
ncbi:MAG: biotin/lipoyl-containing protein [Candidatus Bruticola sp.]